MKDIIHLIRPKDWAKNLFLFVPLFFAGRLFEMETIKELFYGFLCFCAIASAVYIINDYRDIEFDKLHPEKSSRPLASGKISKPKAVILAILLIIAGFTGAWFIRDKFMFVLALYFLLNLAYSFGLKNLPIVDIVIIAIGFVLRIKAGAVIAKVGLTEWLTIMVFLLAFMHHRTYFIFLDDFGCFTPYPVIFNDTTQVIFRTLCKTYRKFLFSFLM